MRITLYIFIFFTSITLKTLGATITDTLNINKTNVNKVITTIKKQLEPKNYYIYSENFSLKDITYSTPSIAVNGKSFEILIKWKEEIIYIYDIDAFTYEIKTITDLR